MQSVASSEVLRGMTPTGTVELTVAFRKTMTGEQKDELLDAYQAQGKNKGYRRVDLRKSNGVDILDLQRPDRTTNEPALDEQGRKIGETSTPLAWDIYAFVSDQSLPGKFDEYELSFVSLDDELYQADKSFLDLVMSSLRYDPTATSGN